MSFGFISCFIYLLTTFRVSDEIVDRESDALEVEGVLDYLDAF